MKQTRSRILIPRDVLLVEIERRCRDAQCNARTRIGLTRNEARVYSGFECERCGQSWDDLLTERDVPEWWEELGASESCLSHHTWRAKVIEEEDSF